MLYFNRDVVYAALEAKRAAPLVGLAGDGVIFDRDIRGVIDQQLAGAVHQVIGDGDVRLRIGGPAFEGDAAFIGGVAGGDVVDDEVIAVDQDVGEIAAGDSRISVDSTAAVVAGIVIVQE